MTGLAVQETRPEDRVPFTQMILYGVGGLVNNLLSGSLNAMMIVLIIGYEMDPAVVGFLAAAPRLFDAFTDPIIGFISDKTKSRWGRRRPFIFIGAILVGIVFALIWQMPEGMSKGFYFWYFMIGSFFLFLAYTIFITPWVALGYELTPDYRERSILMGVQNFFAQVGVVLPTWLLFAMNYKPLFNGDIVQGASTMAIVIGATAIALGILPAIFLRERNIVEETEDTSSFVDHMREFLLSFYRAIIFIPFLKLCIVTFFVFNGFMMIAGFQSFVLIYLIYDGNDDMAGALLGIIGTLGTISGFAIIALVTWLSTRIGKRSTLMLAIAVSMFGYALKWFCYSQSDPYLILIPVPFIAFGLASLFTIIPALMADVVDLDEIDTHERREGMFGSIFWWVVKLGMSAAALGAGYTLKATGFDPELTMQSDATLFYLKLADVVVPVMTSAIAMLALWSFDLTAQKAQEVREELDRRRQNQDGPNPAYA